MSALRRGVAVIGIGNAVRSDDAIGMHAIRCLRERGRAGGGVELIEGGTAGLLLLPLIAAAQRVIIVDAIAVGAPAGTLVRLDGDRSGFATGMTSHEAGLAALLDAARLTDAWPDELVVHGMQPGSTAIGTELTCPVAAALGALVDAIEADLGVWQALSGGPVGTAESAPDERLRDVRRPGP